LLELRSNRRSATVLLLGLGATQALLQIDGETFRVRRTALENAVVDYRAIWRGPAMAMLPLKPGDNGADVSWLRKRPLPAGDASTGTANASTYDANLAAAVRRVQADFGLHIDGIVGPGTLLALMSTDPAGPRLRKLAE
jgi:murein L,D-transpeptidase YcbB/YkuD